MIACPGTSCLLAFFAIKHPILCISVGVSWGPEEERREGSVKYLYDLSRDIHISHCLAKGMVNSIEMNVVTIVQQCSYLMGDIEGEIIKLRA
jgi:hypothetical protein